MRDILAFYVDAKIFCCFDLDKFDKCSPERIAELKELSYENITITNSRYPIFISEYYPKEPMTPQEDSTTVPADYTPSYKSIKLKNITVTDSQESLILWGLPESPIQHVRLENVRISAKNGPQLYNIANAEFINSTITVGSREKARLYQAVVTGLN